MTKEDLIYDLLKKIDKKLDDHINDTQLHGKGWSIKEWGIFSGIITTICTAVITITQTIIK
jgi:hypothetical protein